MGGPLRSPSRAPVRTPVTIVPPRVLRSATLNAVRLLERLGLAQRIVMVIGLSFGLMMLGGYLVSLDSPATFGWFGTCR